MHKLLMTGLVVAGVVAFVGTDVVGATVRRARESVRSSLQKDVPLSTRLAEARAQVDAFAENVIRGEVAAERLAEMVETTKREVARRRGGLERERQSLATLKAGLEAQPTARLVSDGPARATDVEREALRRARDFQVATTLLERRERDLAGLERDWQATVREVEAAKAQQMRLSEEVNVLQAEVAERRIADGGAPLSRAWLGATYAICGEPARARQKLDELHALSEERYVDPSTYADIHASLGEIDEALRCYEQALEQEPGDVAAKWNLSNLLFEEERDAVRSDRLLVEAFQGGLPAGGELIVARAALWRERGRLDRARALLDAAVTAVPGNVPLRLFRGRTRIEQGDCRGAGADFAEAVRRDDGRAGSWAALATAHLCLGERAAARRAFERAVALAPEREELRRALTSLDAIDEPRPRR